MPISSIMHENLDYTFHIFSVNAVHNSIWISIQLALGALIALAIKSQLAVFNNHQTTCQFCKVAEFLRVLTRTNSHIQGSNCGLMHLLPNKMQPSSIVGQERHRICLPTFSPDHHYFSSSVVKRYNGLSYSTTRINFPGVAKSNPPNFHQFHPYTSMSNTLHST